MAPKPNPNNLKLDKQAFEASKQDAAHATEARSARPKHIRLVLGGSAGVAAANTATLAYRKDGFGPGNGNGNGAAKLAGVAYELAPGEKADAVLDSFKIAFESPGNVPVTLVHPVTGGVDVGKLPPPDTPPQFAQVCFALPTIQNAADVQGEANEGKWLALFELASERELTIELAIAPKEEVREAVEKLLGKVWDAEVAAAKKAGKPDDHVNQHGVRILFDVLASPPLAETSTQLARSAALESWSDFVSRLALNPRVFLKVSPLPLPSLLPASIGTPRRPVDTVGSSVLAAPGKVAQAATDAATQAVAAVESATTTSSSDRREEMQQRLRIFLEPALEAFGEERLTFSAYLSSGSATATAAAQQAGTKDDVAKLTEPEQWFETVVATLQNIGVNQSAHDNIFDQNVSKVYRM